jgi:FkbM family methyltransferase
MAADSSARRIVKRILGPVIPRSMYQRIQAHSVARDISNGQFEEPEVAVGVAAVRSGETALDLGANYGMYSVPLSRAVGASGRVIAYEPVPFTAGTLGDVLSRLRIGNVEIRERGCGVEPGPVTFLVPLQSGGVYIAGLAHAAGRHVGSRSGRTAKVICRVVRIDDDIDGSEPVTLIKADIEGMELQAFQGAVRLIERHHPTVICEVTPRFLEDFGASVAELVGFFAEREYGVFEWHGQDTRMVERLDIAEMGDSNYVFIHWSRRDRFQHWMTGPDAPARRHR